MEHTWEITVTYCVAFEYFIDSKEIVRDDGSQRKGLSSVIQLYGTITSLK